MYNSKEWIDHCGKVHKSNLRCRILKIKKFENKNLDELIEFKNIPNWMAQGNVGTPTKTFIKYINECKMPTSLIHKLGINLKHFKSCAKKCYTNVEYDYTKKYGVDEEEKASEDELEDWERHESLHDDVTKQDRTSPYLFEDEIELKWEKGGSGLVFYTDENFWKDYENKDFDAETADDWDLDMRVYYEGDGDKDAVDLIEMRKQDMLRNGVKRDLIDDFKNSKQLNSFKKFKKQEKNDKKYLEINSFARRQMEKFGWKEGQSIGLPVRSGLREPLDASDGKNPLDKSGFGYHGEKIDKNYLIQLKKERDLRLRRESDFFIGSKYDTNLNKPDSLLTRF
ncbi:unnamed protein product [Brachionus calyciflorus]|uniref:G-patch domain-containing protein n=1 Tax=Brachionus calyciflorus TaxID=104777 RepID=A0A814PPM2_9BILA|nr:unnamed protein product [Brachionus calyciflorus]